MSTIFIFSINNLRNKMTVPIKLKTFQANNSQTLSEQHIQYNSTVTDSFSKFIIYMTTEESSLINI